MSLVLGIDLGGTNIKAVLMDRVTGQVRARRSVPTLDGQFVDGVPRFALGVQGLLAEFEAAAGQGPLALGLSAPGLAHPQGHCIQWMPGRMAGLEGFDWSQFLQRQVNVLNDAQAALLGEIWLGAAKGCQDVLMLTLGTGVGGAIVSGGQLLKGRMGRAGHLGHVTTDLNLPVDHFGTPGSLEAAMGNKTIQQRGEGRYASTLDLLAACKQGDAHALSVWDESVRHLAAALATFINILDPERMVLGGGIAIGAGEQLLQPLRARLQTYEWRPDGNAVDLVLAHLGEDAGAFGAAYSIKPLSS